MAVVAATWFNPEERTHSAVSLKTTLGWLARKPSVMTAINLPGHQAVELR